MRLMTSVLGGLLVLLGLTLSSSSWIRLLNPEHVQDEQFLLGALLFRVGLLLNGLAIIIFLAQLGQFKLADTDGVLQWMRIVGDTGNEKDYGRGITETNDGGWVWVGYTPERSRKGRKP